MDELSKITVLLSLAIFAIIIGFGGCTSQQNPQENSQASGSHVLIGLQMTPASTLVQVADEKGFFKKNGIDVEIKEFTAGKFAFQALLANSVDFAVVGDIPVALAKMQGNEFYVVSEVGGNRNEAPLLVADDNSKTMEEFFSKKRKIATSIGGTPEFSLYLNLKEHNVSKENVEIISQKPEEMIGAFSNGSVDGINIFEPYPTIAEEKSGRQTKRFALPAEIYTARYLLTSRKDLADKNPETVKAVLKSLKEAETFVRENPEEAKALVSKRTKFDRAIIEKIWGDFDFSVPITEQLSKNLEMESKWAVETGKAKPGNTDFSPIMRKDLLAGAG
ncbi:NMT1/THI5 like protein [uncultured archaeon]|nr:NMT1/THI5 like protein [uncultured archaeon]